MKILMIGCYFDGTGWSKACIDYILALDAAGAEVVPRTLKLNAANCPPPERILELEARSSSGCDVVIQHTLPSLMDYNGRLHNVGLYASETSHFTSAWADRLNTMDQVVVINNQMVGAARRSGVTRPISVVPHASDVTRFQQGYAPLEALKPYKDAGDFIFYTVGEFTRRKNLGALIRAFHLEFDPSEAVQLVIKTNKSGFPAKECRAEVEKTCDDIKRALRLNGCKPEIIITERLTEQGMCRLHAACDVFVQPSFGEAFSIPCMDAMGFGKTPIVTACTGYLDYVSNETGWLVDCREEPVFGVEDAPQDLFSGTETWSSVDVNHLRRCMREAFQMGDRREDKAQNGISRAFDFSYEAVGLKLLEALQHHGRRSLVEAP